MASTFILSFWAQGAWWSAARCLSRALAAVSRWRRRRLPGAGAEAAGGGGVEVEEDEGEGGYSN